MLEQKKPSRRVFPKIFWSFLIIILVVFSVLFVKAYNASTKIFGSRVSFFSRISQLIFNKGGSRLQGEDSGQINILLLGYGGPGHDGPYLTDSIILASIKTDSNQVLLTSIPRDLYWKTPNGNDAKINQAFSDGLGRKINFDSGGALAEQAASDLSGLAVPYYASVDFQGFVDAVNKVGGVDVAIDRTFTDKEYPNDATNGYLPPITFTQGKEHMDGERALIFVRSRHGTGVEASDFARSKRQQKIVDAFKQKVQSLGTFSYSSTLNDLLSILANHFHTNIEPNQLLHLENLLKSADLKVISQSLDQDSAMVCPKINSAGTYVLLPCAGVSRIQIQNYFSNGFSAGSGPGNSAAADSASGNSNIDSAAIIKERASVILENSGTNGQLYKTTRQYLKNSGLTVYEVPYRGIPLAVSVLYEIHSKPASEKLIEQKLGVQHQSKPPQMTAKSDLVLIIGGSQ